MAVNHDARSDRPTEAAMQVRLDVWLDVACLFRTRSEAQKACTGGKVSVNGQTAKPHRLVRLGDEIQITRLLGRRQTVVVKGLAQQHLPKAVARQLYEDTTPPPSPDEIELRRIEAAYRASLRLRPSRAPTKRERRQLQRLKRWQTD